MIRCRIAATWCVVVLVLPGHAGAQATVDDEVRREVTALAERMERLEAENAALKERNDRLERRVAELESPQVATANTPAVSSAAEAGVSAGSGAVCRTVAGALQSERLRIR